MESSARTRQSLDNRKTEVIDALVDVDQMNQDYSEELENQY
jgi:hypothetical protein